MLVTLIRHAEVEEAYHKRYNGHIDISLSTQGKKESRELALCFKDKQFTSVFCSDLKRCKQTLDAFDLHIQPVYTSKLREKSWGKHEGMSFDDIISLNDFSYENFEQWIQALDGEDYTSYIQRVEVFFKEFLPACTCGEVLVMTHAGVIRVLMHLLDNISLEEAFCKPFGYGNYIVLDTDTWTFQDTQCV
ncbi:histidine phosphatase family protein [Sulfurimonas sp. MAG313]|nr:histidine phosphatase family protein [Sulfurimonas sp. MAG313]MDF1881644.1 histidine phosphatase family protein [Sulfurimonas sp. MAG313]